MARYNWTNNLVDRCGARSDAEYAERDVRSKEKIKYKLVEMVKSGHLIHERREGSFWLVVDEVPSLEDPTSWAMF